MGGGRVGRSKWESGSGWEEEEISGRMVVSGSNWASGTKCESGSKWKGWRKQNCKQG